MEFNFTGSSKPRRTINLSGEVQKPVSALAADARSQREDRRRQKLRASAATRIQAAYRAYATSKAMRNTFAAEFDRLWQNSQRTPSDWVQLTRCLVMAHSRQPSKLHSHRMAAWANDVCGASLWTKPELHACNVLFFMVARRMIFALQYTPDLDVSDARAMILFLLWLQSDSYTTEEQRRAALYMLRFGLHSAIRQCILTFPKEATEECVALSLRPLVLFPEPTTEFAETLDESASASPRSIFIRSFVSDILTLPHLFYRVPISSVSLFASSFPLLDIMIHVQALGAYYDVVSGDSVLAHNPIHSPFLLGNILTIASRRINTMQSGTDVCHYLHMLATLQNALPTTTFDDHDSTVDPKTKKQIDNLISDQHIRSVLATSTRFAHSTRPALCTFLIATLCAWPVSVRDTLLISLLYGYDKEGSTRSMQIGSLVRELWRGWIRSSFLTRKMAVKEQSSSTNVVAMRDALTNTAYAQDWTLFLTMCIVYGRCLVILGDDEFYPRESMDASMPTRNPLTMDELVVLSGLLRNLVFFMHWDNVGMTGDSEYITGTRMRVDQVRELCTRLLQQLHTRDSRHRFVPESHWHMLNENDLTSFIQAVVLEERELAVSQDQDRENHRAPLSAFSQRKRDFMTPRLKVLNNIPFVIPFDVRVEIFRQFVRNDIQRLGISRDMFAPTRRHRATIRRGHVAEDGIAQLNGLGSNLKEPLEIMFVDQWGMPEAGIDGSGLFKEFLVSMIQEVFDTDRGLWCSNEIHELYPNPHSYAHASEQLIWYLFMGRILGKALYEGILVDVKFADFFLSKWLGQQSYIDDLASLESLDSELYRGLIALKNYSGNVESDFALNFTVADDEFGIRTSRELVPGGTDIPVTRENRLSYIYLITRYRLSTQIEDQSRAFLQGLTELINPRWLRLFNTEELRVLVTGADTPIDVEDLRRNTVYGGYHEKDMAVQYFWEALSSLDQASLKAFLRFVTSSPNPPLLGFSELNPKFAIRHAGDDITRLPTASTCVNLLKLPAYNSTVQCLEKLKYAIYSGAGFDLS